MSFSLVKFYTYVFFDFSPMLRIHLIICKIAYQKRKIRLFFTKYLFMFQRFIIFVIRNFWQTPH